jgi:hypothetical protein
MKAQLGISATADLEENTWTFQMLDNSEMCAGSFMIVEHELFKEVTKSLKEVKEHISINGNFPSDKKIIDNIVDILNKL